MKTKMHITLLSMIMLVIGFSASAADLKPISGLLHTQRVIQTQRSTLKVEVKSTSISNLRLIAGGKPLSVTLQGNNLDQVTSAQVILNNKPVKDVEIELCSKSVKTLTLNLKASSATEPAQNYKLQLLGGSQMVSVSTLVPKPSAP